MNHSRTVLFVCVENACRSQMAETLFNSMAPEGWRAMSAGTEPADEVNETAAAVLKEVGLNSSAKKPARLTSGLIDEAAVVITMGCRAGACPSLPNDAQDWSIDDPKGRDAEEFRAARDHITRKCRELIAEIGTSNDGGWKPCYGKMLPNRSETRPDQELDGHVLSVKTASYGIGDVKREVHMDLDQWSACTKCVDYRTCYDLSVAVSTFGS